MFESTWEPESNLNCPHILASFVNKEDCIDSKGGLMLGFVLVLGFMCCCIPLLHAAQDSHNWCGCW